MSHHLPSEHQGLAVCYDRVGVTDVAHKHSSQKDSEAPLEPL